MVRIYAQIRKLAPADLPVLIIGETGCGKELVAAALHAGSPRVRLPMIPLNCAALHEHLAESELFGHERGAFSGAVTAKAGLIEAATGSTLFLDEIGELSPITQAKLLRVLESGRLTRVGDVQERAVDVRILAATNRDLRAEVSAGRFRSDLFFRLSGALLEIPPLRQRPSEISILASTFLEEARRLIGGGPMTISPEAMLVLRAHAWPGNVRELKNVMQYFATTLGSTVLLPRDVSEVLSVRTVTLQHAPEVDPMGAGSLVDRQFRPLADELRELEITRIREALEATGGNQTRAALLLSMPMRTFFGKVKQYGLPHGRPGRPGKAP